MELNDILSDKPIEREEPAPPAAEPAAEPREPSSEAPAVETPKQQSRRKAHQAKEFEAQGRDASGRFLPKEEPAPAAAPAEPVAPAPAATPSPAAAAPAATPTPASPQPEQMTEKEKAFLRAAQEERQKRQALEQELAKLRQPQPAEQPKTFYEAPDEALQTHEQKMEKLGVKIRLDTSEQIARGRYTDFDAHAQAFVEAVQMAPQLYAQMLQSPDPAEFAYQTGKRHAEIQKYGGVQQWEQQKEQELRARIKAELEAEAKKREEEQKRLRDALPGSLSGTPGARHSAVTWSGPTPLENILGGK